MCFIYVTWDVKVCKNESMQSAYISFGIPRSYICPVYCQHTSPAGKNRLLSEIKQRIDYVLLVPQNRVETAPRANTTKYKVESFHFVLPVRP